METNHFLTDENGISYYIHDLAKPDERYYLSSETRYVFEVPGGDMSVLERLARNHFSKFNYKPSAIHIQLERIEIKEGEFKYFLTAYRK